jgi:uncharacterized membrane protein
MTLGTILIIVGLLIVAGAFWLIADAQDKSQSEQEEMGLRLNRYVK